MSPWTVHQHLHSSLLTNEIYLLLFYYTVPSVLACLLPRTLSMIFGPIIGFVVVVGFALVQSDHFLVLWVVTLTKAFCVLHRHVPLVVRTELKLYCVLNWIKKLTGVVLVTRSQLKISITNDREAQVCPMNADLIASAKILDDFKGVQPALVLAFTDPNLMTLLATSRGGTWKVAFSFPSVS
jgi:hypothetical protein